VSRLRVAAIDFLNPAPLLYHFEHSPQAEELGGRYDVHYTQPSLCAAELLEGRADLGLIPVAALTEELAIVPGCTIASLGKVRSIQLVLRPGLTLETVRTVATDAASRSSLAYTQIIFRTFVGNDPEFLAPMAADPVAMLVWAVRPEAVTAVTAGRLMDDLVNSRDAGLQHREELVREWTPRIAVPAATIREYLTGNIYYELTPDCVRGVERFRAEAARIGALAPLGRLRFLQREEFRGKAQDLATSGARGASEEP
jgi:chorismate dehydratase